MDAQVGGEQSRGHGQVVEQGVLSVAAGAGVGVDVRLGADTGAGRQVQDEKTAQLARESGATANLSSYQDSPETERNSQETAEQRQQQLQPQQSQQHEEQVYHSHHETDRGDMFKEGEHQPLHDPRAQLRTEGEEDGVFMDEGILTRVNEPGKRVKVSQIVTHHCLCQLVISHYP